VPLVGSASSSTTSTRQASSSPTPEIEAFLAIEGDNVKRAAAQAIDTNATNEALASKVIKDHQLSTDGAKVADAMRKHAAALRDQADREDDLSDDGAFFEVVATNGPGCTSRAHRYPRLVALMPRPRQAMGRPGTAVIPESWGETHAAVIDRTHASTVRIGPAGGTPTRNPGTRQMETTPAQPVYVGRASIMLASAIGGLPGAPAVVVEDEVSAISYEVTLPYAASAAVAVGHDVTVDDSDPDPALAGQMLRVVSIERGSRRFSRVLLATLNSPA
jgi:hypothetical protein